MSAAQPWHETEKIPHGVFTFSSYTDFNSIELTGTVLFAFSSVLEDNQSGLHSVALQRIFQINELLLNGLWQMIPKLHRKGILKPAKRLVIIAPLPEIGTKASVHVVVHSWSHGVAETVTSV